ncbi:MAG: cysteine desulfurase family protein [Candidatus Latescibacterota bacterium]
MPGIYLDHNATTPVRPEVLETMLPYLTERIGNPSSLHRWGREAREGIEGARASVARLLGCAPAEIHFTSGGTEADNWAIKGVAAAAGRRGQRLVTTRIEHPAVLGACRYLERRGFEVVYLPVDALGVVDPTEVARAVDERTVLISVMHANNETGVLQPVAEIGALAWERGVPLHVDAVQSLGKVAVEVDRLSADLVAVSAHKIGGPKGVGALYVRSGMELESLAHGGGHEHGRRAGTENVAGIVGMGRAAELLLAELVTTRIALARLRDRLEQGVLATVDGVRVNGHPILRLPNTTNLSFAGVDSQDLVKGFDLLGVAAASGSACASDDPSPSHVLVAMGLGPREAAGAVRFSLGRQNTEAEVDRVLGLLPELVARLRRLPAL